MDKIYINNLELIGTHGVFQEEKNLGQKFIISVEMETATRKAGKTGDLSESTHYGYVADDIEKLFTSKSNDLIETCAEEIAEMILKKYPLIAGVKVIIKKPWAPLRKIFENVAVEIERRRHKVYLSLGSNIGNKQENLLKAIDEISKLPNTKINKVSKILETEPFGNVEQDLFLNAAIEVETLLEAEEFLEAILKIELDMGRVREIHWGPRIIDIDILLFDKEIYETEKLAVPHPWMCERLFVLEPLAEIAPNVVHPLERKTINNLKRELEGNSNENRV
jgi:dihydroneopterin aldolase/2-amino-4-hydroxy-6-hydroxymethyldihydropteridine diphosphokinase